MFQQLVSDIRSLVISRIFASRPRRIQLTLTDSSDEVPVAQPQTTAQPAGKKKKKRKRHRHKKK
jgi:hypothetical protein